MIKAFVAFVGGLVLTAVLLVGITPTSAQDNITNFNGVQVESWFASKDVTQLTITGDVTTPTTLNPYGSQQPLTASGTVTAVMGIVQANGQALPDGARLTLYNTAAQTIVISETSTFAGAGNTSLGQYDTLSLFWDGTRWYQTGTSNN